MRVNETDVMDLVDLHSQASIYNKCSMKWWFQFILFAGIVVRIIRMEQIVVLPRGNIP